MKKLLLLIALFGSCFTTSNAITQRIFVKDNGTITSNGGGFKIYVWYSDGSTKIEPAGEWSDDNKMVQITTSNNVGTKIYYKDIDLPANQTVNFILYAVNNDKWRVGQDNVDLTGKYLEYNDGTPNKVTLKDIDYYLYKTSDGSSIKMTTNDYQTFSGVVDNQTSFDGDLHYLIAPSFVITDYASDNQRWAMMYRPWDDNQTLPFKTISNYHAGIFTGNNSLALTAKAKYEISINVVGSFENASKITSSPYIDKAIGAYAYSSFSSDYAFATPEGVTAYYASDASSKRVTLSPITNGVPAGQGVILNGTAGETVKLTPAATTDALTGNKLVAVKSGAAIPASTGTQFNYVFAYQNDDLGFFKLTNSVNATADMAYLQTSEDISNAKVVFGFDEEATGIESIENTKADNAIYNLNGVRVDNPTKGIFIQNGKKVIIK